MSRQHADEARPTFAHLLNAMRLIDRGGSRPLVVPATMMQAAELIEELRARLERNEQLLRNLVEALEPIVNEHNSKKAGFFRR